LRIDFHRIPSGEKPGWLMLLMLSVRVDLSRWGKWGSFPYDVLRLIPSTHIHTAQFLVMSLLSLMEFQMTLLSPFVFCPVFTHVLGIWVDARLGFDKFRQVYCLKGIGLLVAKS